MPTSVTVRRLVLPAFQAAEVTFVRPLVGEEVAANKLLLTVFARVESGCVGNYNHQLLKERIEEKHLCYRRLKPNSPEM